MAMHFAKVGRVNSTARPPLAWPGKGRQRDGAGSREGRGWRVLGGIWPQVGAGERCAWRGRSSACSFHLPSIFSICLCDLTVVLAEEALLSCISKISVRQQERTLA